MTNVTISGNSASDYGGGIYNSYSSHTLTRVTISGNSAILGGGIYNSYSSLVIKSSIIWRNKGTYGEENIWNTSSTSTFSHSLVGGSNENGFWSGNPTDGNQNGGNNIDADPKFVNWIDPSATGWTATTEGDYRLQASSPASGMGANEQLTPLYVKEGATGDGSSWTNAYSSLTDALAAAKDGDNIYIAVGTYKPGTVAEVTNVNPELTGRDRTFLITKSVKIYGGFDATNPEASPDNRKPENFSKTILSGDLDGDGKLSDGDAYHVVVAVGQDGTPITPTLDGLLITGGNANTVNSVKINNLFIAQNAGGGVYNNYSDVTITNVMISGNSAGNGGGIYVRNSEDATLTQVTISGNSAESGSGIYSNNSSPTLTRVTVSGNKALFNGGGMYNNLSSSPVIESSIIWGNSAGDGDNVNNENSTPTFSYSLIGGSGEDDFWSAASGNQNGGKNLDADPKFVSWIDPSATGWTATTEGDYRLQASSPASGMGANEQLTPLYVKEGATGNNDGSSWTNAYSSLTDALAAAKDGDNIYLATGTYTPGDVAATSINGLLTGRDRTFLITKDVHIYGGFAGSDMTENVATRSPENFTRTILSGDLGTENDASDNAYHVVLAVGKRGAPISPTLDGLVITGANADGEYPAFVNDYSCAQENGGGIASYSSNATLTNITISGNSATTGGGGGMFNEHSSHTLTRVTISGNSAKWGGGIYNISSPLVIESSIIWGNKASVNNNNIQNGSSILTFSYSLIEGSDKDGFWSEDPTEGNQKVGDGNIDKDPMFVNWIDPSATGWTPTTDGDYSLYKGSLALGAGKDGVNMGAYQGLGEAKPEEPDPTVYVTVSFTVDAGFALQPSATSVSVAQGGSYDFYLSRKEGTENEPLVTANGVTLETYYMEEQDKWYCSLNPVMGDTQVVITLGDIVDNDNPEDGLQVYSTVGGLVITTATPTPVTIYSITGSAVAQQLVEGQVTFTLPQGIYIIRTAEVALKAVVR